MQGRAVVMMQGTYVEIHLINQRTRQDTVVQLGGTFEQGQADWVLDQTGIDYSRFRFVETPAGIQLDYIEGDSAVRVDGVEVTTNTLIRDGSLLRVDDEEFRCEVRRQQYANMLPAVDAGWLSMTGSVREHNEDAVGIYQQPPYYLFAVADGVGGAESGEIISEFAIKYMLHTFGQHLGPQTDWVSVFRAAVRTINDEARRYAHFLSETGGKRVQAGCTLTAVVLNGWDGYLIHVGDSRFYHQQGGVLRQVSVDHSTFPMENMDPRQTMAGGAINTTKRNVLMKGIGKSDTIEPDFKHIQFKPGDKLLLCSDGMSDRVGEPELSGLLETTPPQKLAAYLGQTADERRSGDNISVVVVHLGMPGQMPAPVQPMPQPRAFIGMQSRPQLASAVDSVTSGSTETGGTHLPLQVIVPAVIVILLLIIVGLVLARGAG